jgi:hypothetical protein
LPQVYINTNNSNNNNNNNSSQPPAINVTSPEGYIRITGPAQSGANNRQQQEQNSGYLTPSSRAATAATTNGYLEPQQHGTPNRMRAGEMQPTTPQQKHDTYGGVLESPWKKMNQLPDTYINDDFKQGTYINDDFDREKNRSNNSNSNYVMPQRHGSNLSSATVNSTTSSTAPLTAHKLTQSSKVNYAPPPPSSAHVLGTNKLSRFKVPSNVPESDV